MGGEYYKLNTFLKSQGILHRIACAQTHEQNELAECKICHIVYSRLTLLALGGVLFKYQPYAFDNVVKIINYLPSIVTHNSSPYFKLFGKHAHYKAFKVFGCHVFPLLRPYK